MEEKDEFEGWMEKSSFLWLSFPVTYSLLTRSMSTIIINRLRSDGVSPAPRGTCRPGSCYFFPVPSLWRSSKGSFLSSRVEKHAAFCPSTRRRYLSIYLFNCCRCIEYQSDWCNKHLRLSEWVTIIHSLFHPCLMKTPAAHYECIPHRASKSRVFARAGFLQQPDWWVNLLRILYCQVGLFCWQFSPRMKRNFASGESDWTDAF